MSGPTQGGPVKAKVVVVDPATMMVVWLNEAAREGVEGLAAADTVSASDRASALAAVDAIPVAESMGVPEALKRVAQTGEPQHLATDVVSMGRGSITLATSIYRLPDGMLLVVTENAWQAAERTPRDSAARSGRRRTR